MKAPTLPLPLSLSIVTKRDFEDKYVSSKNYQQFLCNKSSFNYKEKEFTLKKRTLLLLSVILKSCFNVWFKYISMSLSKFGIQYVNLCSYGASLVERGKQITI